MTARSYQLVLGEITTALFACPDCGAVVWHSLRDRHDGLHAEVDRLGTEASRLTELLDADGSLLDEHAGQIAHLQGQVGDLESKTYRLDDQLRDVGYRADDAMRTAERAQSAADSAGRGW